MQKYFIFTDKQQIEIAECLKQCRLNDRCLTLATLILIGETREWKGIPSTTQLIKGVYQTMLEITKDYAVNPKNEMWKIQGTSIHKALEKNISEALIEKDFGYLIGKKTGVSGIPDILECENNENILTDYKNFGSFKMQLILGLDWTHVESDELYKKRTEITLRDGTKTTRQKGENKLKKEFRQIKDPDLKELILQLNHYKILIEEQGFKVDKLRIQAIVRDGGLQIAFSRGIDEQVYLVNIPIIDENEIVDYFVNKRLALKKALQDGDFEKCNSEETWDGNRCNEKYCKVYEFCKYMGES
jgi:hypothetical protein